MGRAPPVPWPANAPPPPTARSRRRRPLHPPDLMPSRSPIAAGLHSRPPEAASTSHGAGWGAATAGPGAAPPDAGHAAPPKASHGAAPPKPAVKKHAVANMPYASICDATAQVLESHGLIKVVTLGNCCTIELQGKKAAADGSECEDRVVVDGNVITSRSPRTAMEFAVAIVEKLMGREAAREVAEGLLFV